MLPLLWGVVALLGAAVDNEPGPSGLALSAALEGGVVGGDGVLGLSIGAGVDTEPFSLHLQAPLLLRVVDAGPPFDPALPSSCAFVRCEELLSGERLDPTAIARLIDEVRIFRPGDVFHLRAGALTATLGAGAVVDRFTTASSWDRRTSGVFAALRLPWHALRADLLVADVVSPGELTAARIELEPLNEPWLRLALDSGVDVGAPVDLVDRHGSQAVGSDTRALTSTALTAGFVLLDGAVDLLPRLELQATTGLSSDGGRQGSVGAGVGAGVDVGVDFAVIDARLKLTGTLGTDGQRRGLFQTLYLVERRAALVGAAVGGGGIARVPAPAGAGLDARLEASIFDVVAPLLRLHLEPATGANVAEVGIAVDVESVLVSLSILRRAFTGADIVGPDLERQPVVGALQASWRFWGPLSLSLRWLRLPRFGSPTGLRVDDDVLLSLAANAVLVPQ